jgi:phosphoribosylaminoimidazole-succinocarboxamide synthase
MIKGTFHDNIFYYGGTHLLSEIKNLPIIKSHFIGKVKAFLDIGDQLLIVYQDKVNASGVEFSDQIPGKGQALCGISSFLFTQTRHILKNHFITTDLAQMPQELSPFHEYLTGRTMLVKKNRAIPYEFSTFGYHSGKVWEEYKSSGTVAGLLISQAMRHCQRFDTPAFLPSLKTHTNCPEDLTFSKLYERMDHALADIIRDKSVQLYQWGHEFFEMKGILLADTVFEFGTLDGELYLIDEIFTPYTSSFWSHNDYEVGTAPKRYDQQYIRDYISHIRWDSSQPAPKLPDDIVEKTSQKYKSLHSLIVG